MTWLTWKQSQRELLIGGIVLAFVAAFLIWTGRGIISSYHSAGLPACVAQGLDNDECRSAANTFLQRFDDLRGIRMVLMLCLPFLAGLLLAAPTVADFEQGTYRLVWTQSVTRRRWIATKMAFGLAIMLVISAAFVALWTWRQGPFDALEGRFNSNTFDFEGPVPIAYAIFAFALCLALGALTRRVVTAVTIGLVGFLGVRALVEDQLRPHYLSPITHNLDLTTVGPSAASNNLVGAGAWILRQGLIDANGHLVTPADPMVRACALQAGSKGNDLLRSCLSEHGITNAIVYHPANRYWIFQGIETALFLGLSAALLWLTFWWVTRRIV
jgi:hypothetical protein